jgi:hypothetical protein
MAGSRCFVESAAPADSQVYLAQLLPKVKDGIFNEHIEGEGLAGMRACT